MIKLEAIEITEFRGIRHLVIEFGSDAFAIFGRNGSGKSGVVDAIDFALTGNVSRLVGRGTSGLSVKDHAPHVEYRNDPGAAEVKLTVKVPSGDVAVLTRNVRTCKSYSLEPENVEIRAAIEVAAAHPELTLSRREIIKFIVTQPGERAKAVQALLRLERIEDIRTALKSAKSKLRSKYNAAQRETENAKSRLMSHLDLTDLRRDEVLISANQRRRVLGLVEIEEFTPTTVLDDGVDRSSSNAFDKAAALRDLDALDAHAKAPDDTSDSIREQMAFDIAKLVDDPELFKAIQRKTFLETGLAFVDDESCPLCDQGFASIDTLRSHLRSKLAVAEDAELLKGRLTVNASTMAQKARHLARSITSIVQFAQAVNVDAEPLLAWASDLNEFAGSLSDVEGIVSCSTRLATDWIATPLDSANTLAALRKVIESRPDESAARAAANFLAIAQDRLNTYRQCQRAQAPMRRAAQAADAGYEEFCATANGKMEQLYQEVQDEFADFYRAVNANDESGFEALLEPAEGALDLTVQFYGRGMFPPAAYHSEGHQDGMGVCLYLALMHRVQGDDFRLAVLDDVVMSVDAEHREEFCRLLRTRFPNTQFIITTHDRTWFRQMQKQGLVSADRCAVFRNWTVEHGPVFGKPSDVWEEIDDKLSREDVTGAAAQLRHSLELMASDWAEALGASVRYSTTTGPDLSELISGVNGRLTKILKLARSSADHWDNAESRKQVDEMFERRKAAIANKNEEDWAINVAVHYNADEDFTPKEFTRVVDAMRVYAALFSCDQPACKSGIYVDPPRGSERALRCDCGRVNLNLAKS